MVLIFGGMDVGPLRMQPSAKLADLGPYCLWLRVSNAKLAEVDPWGLGFRA